MADREKVIKGLECCAAMSGDECRKCPYGDECRDTDLPYGMPHLASDALAILKEQEPKPVELHTNAYGTKFYFCPKCKRELFHTRNLNFCERCGQAVKWK